MTRTVPVKNILAAVSEKENIDELMKVLSDNNVSVWATEGTAAYIRSKGIKATSVVSGFDFDGRVKTLDRTIMARVLADRTKENHLTELSRLGFEPFDAVVVELYKTGSDNFPECMDIGGVTLIRAAIKNFENIAVAFDKPSIDELANELISRRGETSFEFRKQQAKRAINFIAERCKLEADLF